MKTKNKKTTKPKPKPKRKRSPAPLRLTMDAATVELIRNLQLQIMRLDGAVCSLMGAITEATNMPRLLREVAELRGLPKATKNGGAT